MSKLTQNITDLQSVLDRVNALPEAGTELPELANPATASELFADKELIDADGNVVKGTFSIDEELTTQDDLIAQIQTALEGKASGGGGASVETCTVTVDVEAAYIDQLAATQYINGVISTYGVYNNKTKTIALNNIVCGSAIYVKWTHTPVLVNVSMSNDITLVYNYYDNIFVFSAPTTANVNATITIRDDD